MNRFAIKFKEFRLMRHLRKEQKKKKNQNGQKVGGTWEQE